MKKQNEEKKIKIMIEVPENWIDIDSPILWSGRTIYELAKEEVKDAIVEQYLKKITLPKIKINPKEIKEKMLQILAERALEKQYMKPNQKQLEEWEKEFDKRFVLDVNREIFGDPEELKKQGWEVGKGRVILKQDLEPENIKDFIRDLLSLAEKRGRKEGSDEFYEYLKKNKILY